MSKKFKYRQFFYCLGFLQK